MSMNINEGAFLLIPVILVLQLIAFTNCQAPAIVILIYLLLNGLSVFFVGFTMSSLAFGTLLVLLLVFEDSRFIFFIIFFCPFTYLRFIFF